MNWRVLKFYFFCVSLNTWLNLNFLTEKIVSFVWSFSMSVGTLLRLKLYGSFTPNGTGTGTGTGKQWVSILRYLLYTLHRDRNRDIDRTIVFYCTHPGPYPVPGPVQCAWAISHNFLIAQSCSKQKCANLITIHLVHNWINILFIMQTNKY